MQISDQTGVCTLYPVIDGDQSGTVCTMDFTDTEYVEPAVARKVARTKQLRQLLSCVLTASYLTLPRYIPLH